jgi:hypothetical protein
MTLSAAKIYRGGDKWKKEHGWYYTDKGNPKYSDRNLPQCYSLPCKYYTGFAGKEPLPCHERPATNSLNHGSADNCKQIRIQNK